MTRRTSIAAYHEIEFAGLLSKKRFEIYKILYKYGPLTYNEVFKKIVQRDSVIASANVGARLNEMREMGVVEEAGERLCSITGMNVILWDVTDKLPTPLVKSKEPTRTDLINALCDKLEVMCDHLNAQGDKVPMQWRTWCDESRNIVKQCGKYRKKK